MDKALEVAKKTVKDRLGGKSGSSGGKSGGSGGKSGGSGGDGVSHWSTQVYWMLTFFLRNP